MTDNLKRKINIEEMRKLNYTEIKPHSKQYLCVTPFLCLSVLKFYFN